MDLTVVAKKPFHLPKSREFLKAAKKGNEFVTEALLRENKYYIFEYNNVKIIFITDPLRYGKTLIIWQQRGTTTSNCTFF